MEKKALLEHCACSLQAGAFFGEEPAASSVAMVTLADAAELTGGYAFKSTEMKSARVNDSEFPVVKIRSVGCRVSLKSGILRADKSGNVLLKIWELERGRVEKDGWEGVIERWGFEEEDVAVVEDAADEVRAGRRIHGEAEVTDGDLAVVADTDGRANAPDETPPGAVWGGSYFGLVAGAGEFVCSVGSGVEFGAVGVGEDGVEQCVSGVDGVDGVGSEKRRVPFLPVVVAAFGKLSSR